MFTTPHRSTTAAWVKSIQRALISNDLDAKTLHTPINNHLTDLKQLKTTATRQLTTADDST
ncbi:unnamed protein product, partial [Ceratitis capitata]